VSLPNFGGKLLVLNFWATWCPPCVQETPSLSQFAATYANKGVVVLGVSVDKDEKAYRNFLQKFNPAFLYARDFKLHEGLRHVHVPGDLHNRFQRQGIAQAGRAGRLDGSPDDAADRLAAVE
jgi:thiol-disulfide isomerase/thioredoxin